MEGIRVYVPHETLVWVPATVLSVDASGHKVRVRLDSPSATPDDPCEERTLDLRDDQLPSSLPLQNSAHTAACEDMCDLAHLHEPAIVYNLQSRFHTRHPYTYTGKIVIAVNPYEWLKKLYAEDVRDAYTSAKWRELPPHVYATSAEAFQHMRTHKLPQSILVSGESGAGKTETVKILMEHLASISLRIAKDMNSSSMVNHLQVDENESIVQKVLKSNPLLEAFGNAKTHRNDNSSRFGKFTQLQFNTAYCLIGAECRHYLLEKSRVVAQSKGERNYHIFYQLVSAKQAQFGFTSQSRARDFRYLQDEPLLLDGQTDLERYSVTCDALSTIGVSEQEQQGLFKALCGVLRLGQLEFVPLEGNKDDASQPLASLAAGAGGASHSDAAIQQQQQEIAQCASLLGVDVKALSLQLCSRTVKARQEVYCVPLSTLQAVNNRDALAKELYARLFAYLVRRVNKSISGSALSSQSKSYLHIDLLDIFGFESFQHNSFEQFCINFANEKLQQKFTQDVFKTVQQEYDAEDVPWDFIKFQDNQDMLDLLENPMGLMGLLNEECIRPMGSDATFASKCVSVHESNPRLEKARLSQMHFILQHYAGSVTYDATGFVEKNKDSLQSDLLDLLATSTNGLIAGVFGASSSGMFGGDDDLAAVHAAASMPDTSSRRSSIGSGRATIAGSSSLGGRSALADLQRGSSRMSHRKAPTFMQETVSYKFKAQLALLMNDISATEVHYVRCIKPNSTKSSSDFEIGTVVSQLRCAGVVEAIRITRAAFPNKMLHESFLRRFVFMKNKTPSNDQSPTPALSNTVAIACEQLINMLLTSSKYDKTHAADEEKRTFVVGRTLIYFGEGVLEHLEHQRTGFVHECASTIQHAARKWLALKRFRRFRSVIVTIQAHYRRQREQMLFQKKRHCCIQLQTIWRGFRSRQWSYLMMKIRMAIRIQSFFRWCLARRQYNRFRQAVVKMQSKFKMKQQVGKYHNILEGRKEQAIIETEVDRLRQRLDEERRARLEIEAQNTSLQQELDDVRQSTVMGAPPSMGSSYGDNDLLPPYGMIPPSAKPPSSVSSYATNASNGPRHYRSTGDSSFEDSKLLDDSERMLDYLRKEVHKGRELTEALTHENENLKSENKKIKEAYNAAGSSFAALNQHNKQQSKANLRLMSTHAALIKSQEEKMKKYQKQIADLKEDLKMQRNVYSAELIARVQQQERLVEVVRLAESRGVSDDVIDAMRSLLADPKHSTHSSGPAPTMQEFSGNRLQRSDTSGSTAPVPVSVSYRPAPTLERRSTLDTIMMNPKPVRASVINGAMSPHADEDEYAEREHSMWAAPAASSNNSSRSSMYGYDDETRQRKSKIGGMFKKMFKKDSEY